MDYSLATWMISTFPSLPSFTRSSQPPAIALVSVPATTTEEKVVIYLFFKRKKKGHQFVSRWTNDCRALSRLRKRETNRANN